MNPLSNEWPDGWIQLSSGEIPVEVVEAFERTPDEDPRTGARWMREYVKVEKDAAALAEEGVFRSFGVIRGERFMIDPAVDLVPINTYPTEVWSWIATAVRQKVAKNYAGAEAAILGVYLHHPLALDPGELTKAADAVGAHPFREIWVVNAYGDPASRVP